MNLMMKYIYPFMTLSLLLSIQGNAQEHNISTQNLLSETTILSPSVMGLGLEHHNRNVTVISGKDIEKLPVKSINEVLAYALGVDVRQRGVFGTQADVSIDGGTFDQTLVLVNGIPVTDAQTGHNMMNLPIALDDIARIEILRGAAANVFGVNALMGAINIVTKSVKSSGLNARLNSGTNFKNDSATSATYYSVGAEVSYDHYHNEQFQQRISAGYNKGNGYRYNTGFEQLKANYQNKYQWNNNQIQAWLGFVDNDYGANAFYAAPGDKNATEKVQQVFSGLQFKHEKVGKHTFNAQVSYQYKFDDYVYIPEPLAGQNIHKNNLWDIRLHESIVLGKNLLGLGLNFREERINSTNLGERNRENYGFVADYQWNILQGLKATLGGFVNYNTDFGWQFFPGIDVGYQATQALKFWGNISTAQRLPTYTDLYYSLPKVIEGNANLKPEHSQYYEIGGAYQLKQTTLSARYFYRRLEDFIDWTKNDENESWKVNNFQQINTSGVSFEIKHQWKWPHQFMSSLNTKLGYNYLNPKIVEDVNVISRYRISALRNQFISHLGIGIKDQFNLGINYRYLERVSYKKYGLLDARLSYNTPNRKFNVYYDVTNLGNVTYTEAGSVPLPGSWHSIGVQVNLK